MGVVDTLSSLYAPEPNFLSNCSDDPRKMDMTNNGMIVSTLTVEDLVQDRLKSTLLYKVFTKTTGNHRKFQIESKYGV